jgi:phosphoribosyl 1,2-cyclic phosphodiesterase
MSSLSTPTVEVRFWGVRGSSPVTRPEMLGYGGNTPCVSVRVAEGPLLIFDGGTGVLGLGEALSRDDLEEPIEVFLTHLHLDHIQGLPFFPALHRRDCEVRIHAPPQREATLEDLLGSRLAPVYFPVPIQTLGSRLVLRDVQDSDPLDLSGVRVDSTRVAHPSNTHGYRIRAGGVTIVYIPDNELAECGADVADRLTAFCAGADLLIHDAMFEDEEYATRWGWGHSTFAQATELAIRAGVRALCYFHHAPWRTDSALDAAVRLHRERIAADGAKLKLFAAREGMTVCVRPGAVTEAYAGL